MAEPDGVYVCMGVNGVGKSTLTNMLAAAFPNALTIHVSQEMMRILGFTTREELNNLNTKEKLARRTKYLMEVFQRARSDHRLVLIDMHLMVPIREGDAVRYETTWSDEYTNYISGAYMLTAEPVVIRDWREHDAKNTGRKRDLSLDNIMIDQQLNIREFSDLVNRKALPRESEIIENQPGLIHEIGDMLVTRILNSC